jgi:hypothetical protein
MLGKILGAAAGAEASKFTTAFGGTTGAVMGALAAPLVRRLSIPALVVLGAGGYFAKRYYDKRHADNGEAVSKASRKAGRTATA